MSNNKQTAVEWLINQIEEKTKNGTFCTIDYMRKHCFEQAKEMDVQQKGYSEEDLREAFIAGQKHNQWSFSCPSFYEWLKQLKNK